MNVAQNEAFFIVTWVTQLYQYQYRKQNENLNDVTSWVSLFYGMSHLFFVRVKLGLM